MERSWQYFRTIGLAFSCLLFLSSAPCWATGGKAPDPDTAKIPTELRSLTAPGGHLMILRKFLEEADANSSLLASGCDILKIHSQKEWSDAKSELMESKGFEISVQPKGDSTKRASLKVKQYHVNTFSVITSDDGRLDFYGGNYFTKDDRAGDGVAKIYETKWLISVEKSSGKIKEITKTVLKGLNRSKVYSQFECK